MADLSWIAALIDQDGGSGSGGVSDYDQLKNRPVTNISGTGIVIASLATGVYNIEGTWKITTDDEERTTLADDLFYVMNDGTECKLTWINASQIKIFTVPTGGTAVDITEGEIGVQSDWNQNDSTAADFVKNRPFYTGDPVETVFVDESTIPFVERNGLYVAETPSTFEATVGETYKVTWDGTAYECICAELENTPFLGNPSICDVGSDTGEPFLMGVINSMGIFIYTTDTSDSHTFSVSGLVSEVVKIDERYLSDTVATKSEVEAAQTTANAAQRTADAANTAAVTAQNTAVTAQNTAVTAQNTAVTAQNTAVTAVKYTTSQNLTDAQKQRARTNIGAGTSSFSGNYNDLVNKPISLSALIQSDTDTTRIDVLDDTITDDAVRICSTQHIFDTSSSIFTNLVKDTIYRYYDGGEQTLYSPELTAGWGLIDSVNANGTVYSGVGIGIYIGSSKEKYFFISNNGFIIIPDKMLISNSSTKYFKIQYGGADLTMPIAYLSERFIPPAIQRVGDDLILASSTADSTKKFRITVDDSGTLTATEVV